MYRNLNALPSVIFIVLGCRQCYDTPFKIIIKSSKQFPNILRLSTFYGGSEYVQIIVVELIKLTNGKEQLLYLVLGYAPHVVPSSVRVSQDEFKFCKQSPQLKKVLFLLTKFQKYHFNFDASLKATFMNF